MWVGSERNKAIYLGRANLDVEDVDIKKRKWKDGSD
jgi:hypothetical protein